MSQVKILVFAGSARKDSFNKKLARAAADTAEKSGASVTYADLADYPAAVYNGDDEDANGIPQSMRDFKALMQQHDGFVISTPEYNGHIPPLLCNTFDWASRTEGDEKGKVAFDGKKAAIMATSPGRLGGIRVLPRLRDTLAELGVVVVPGFVTLPLAEDTFDGDTLQSEPAQRGVQRQIDKLIAACS